MDRNGGMDYGMDYGMNSGMFVYSGQHHFLASFVPFHSVRPQVLKIGYYLCTEHVH